MGKREEMINKRKKYTTGKKKREEIATKEMKYQKRRDR